jgi:hypothetical protein
MVSLRDLDGLLESVLVSSDERATLKRRIRLVLEDIRDYRDEPRSILMPDPGNPESSRSL